MDDNADVFAATFEEAGGSGMAVESAVGDFVVFTDLAWVGPFEEVGFDKVAVTVPADLAFAAVAFGVGRGGSFVGEMHGDAGTVSTRGGFELGVEGLGGGDELAEAGFGFGWLGLIFGCRDTCRAGRHCVLL